jgi:ClpP class serine protease
MPTAHSLLWLTERLYNVPHLITESAFTPILEYLNDRNNLGLSSTVVAEAKTAKKAEHVGGIGEIAIDGPITYKPVMTACGPQGVSYQGILEQAEYLIDEGVKTLILTHSSPGGEAQHCFSTANDLRAMCDEHDVRLISYIDTLSASASLALGIVADEVIIHPSASTGSVGCVLALLDKSKAYEKAGLKPIYIASTAGKTPFQADGSFSQEFLDSVQEDVTRLGTQFAEHVSAHTGISVDDVLAMNAKMYHAEAALEIGLVNKIMDHKTFTAYVADLHKEQRNAG